jgi:MoaA/NifB/PqqE/SkfB family radical SAM enzyme
MKRSRKDLLRLKGILTDRVFVGPRMVRVLITNVCNLSCRYCFFYGDKKDSLSRPSAPALLPWNVFQSIVDDCRDLGVEEIAFSGEGDPLMHPLFEKMVLYVCDRGLRVSVNTNGAYANNRLIDALGRASLVSINLASVTDDMYDRLQSDKKGLYAQVVKNCRRILKNRGRLPTPFLRLVCVLNRNNYRQIGAIVDIAQFLGFDYIRFAFAKITPETKPVSIRGRHLEHFRRILLKEESRGTFKKIETNIRSIYNLWTEVKFLPAIKEVRFKEYSKAFTYERRFDPEFRCYRGWYFSFIDLKGRVYCCCNNRRISIGNIYEQTFREIWHSEAAMRARIYLRDRFDIRKPFWRECHECGDKEEQIKIGSEIMQARARRFP